MGGGGHWQRGGEELLHAAAALEKRMRPDYVEALELITELGTRDVAVEFGYPSLAELLRDVLRISPTEARRRIGHASVVTEVAVVSGGVVAATLPVTVRHWADGGPTQLDNLVLLCGRHRRLIHHSPWECAVTDGHPEFRPPAFVDHRRTPRRNILHTTG